MNSIFLPTACLGLALACQLNLLKPLPTALQYLAAIVLYLAGISFFQLAYGWWWAVPFWLGEFMGFGFLWVFLLNTRPKLALYAAWSLVALLGLCWLMTPISFNTVDFLS